MFLGSWLLAPSMGVGGVALASSAAAGLNFLVLYGLLYKRIGSLMSELSKLHLLKVSGAAIPMSLLGGYSFFILESMLQQDKWQAISLAIVYSVLLSGLYVLLLYAFKDKEILQLSQTVFRRIKR